MFITDTADNFDTETDAGVSQEQFAKKLDSFKENRLFSDFLFGLCCPSLSLSQAQRCQQDFNTIYEITKF